MNNLKSFSNPARGFRVMTLLASVLLSCGFLTAQETGSSTGMQQSPAQAQGVTVPEGTKITVRMIDPVNSDNNEVNTSFRGSLEGNLMAGDQVAAPRGTIVYASLLSSQASTNKQGGELELDLTGIMIDNQIHSLATSSVSAQGAAGSPSGAGRGAAKGAAAGAVISAVTGPGIVVGTALGATAGAVAGAVRRGPASGEKVSVPAGALVEFTLNQPVTLPPIRQ
jgi:hypothetical protein